MMITGNLYDILAHGFEDRLDRPAFIEPGGRETSYGALAESAARTAAWLISHEGVEPGDRVALLVDKSVESVILYLATLMAGAVFVPVNPVYTPAEIAYFVENAEPRLLIEDGRAFVERAAAMPPLARTVARTADDLAAIIYTSGTTGRSKGAMLTHGNLAANARVLHALWGFTPDDVLLHALPIFHVHGLFVALHCAMLSGAPMLWLAKYDDAQVLAMLPRATVMMGVPTFYTRLLARPEFGRAQTGHMRLFISGSAPLLASTHAVFEVRTGHRILERYGMSEAVIITSNPLRGERVAGSVGYPLPGVELRIAEPDDQDTGVIQIRGPSVFGGYWRMPEKTKEEFTADGWFVTGDVGRCDGDGRVWISGRAKDLIISGGYNVYPKEVELVLDDLPGITESAVVGVPHPDFGEAVVAVILGDAPEADVIAAARATLAPYKIPKRVVTLDELPRNAMGKVQKNVLRQELAGLFGAVVR
ncbi:MAG TPA: AMP-binding protein [Sphingobium sp.]|uniref:AMP-binding protein n=1 Tax=Sphingobium sp. TaxID=1912891 RepID=UPI002ED674B2